MKKFILFITLTLITFAGFSQTKGISYQAVIIDPNPIELPGQDIVSQPYVSKDVWIKFGIYSGSTLQYEELQKTKTDEYGLVNLIIGSGINTGQAGTFTSLSWDGPTKNIVTSVSFDQGTRYTQVSNQRLNYVPYSYFAESAGKLSGVLSINQGGTGATNAVAARANLGLGNVDNTADADKPISLATLAILDVKESLANKSQNIIADSASIVKYPSVKAIKDYIDNRTVNSNLANQANNANLAAKATALATPRTINGVPFDGTANISIPVGVTPPDADAATKGLVQLAGDLSGTAAAPTIAAGAVGTAKLADGSVTNAKIVSVAGSKVTGDIAGNAATATLAATATSAEKATKLTTSRTINGVAFDGTADITIPVGVTPVDADATTKGILQLAGDLSGTAISPSIAAGAVGTAKLADGSVTSGKLADASVTNAKIVSVAGSKVTGDIAGNAATATLAADATKLATPRNINGIPFDGTADITISASSSTLSGTISIANGGTGATTAAGARTNLGLAIGTDVQAPLSFTAPLVQNGNGVSISQATPSVAGFLSSVDYTSFSNKIDATEKGANNGVATLGNNGKIPSVQIPAISFQNVNVVNSDASMIAISGAQVGSIAIRTDNNQNFVLSALPASTLSNWIALATPLYVSSVNGYAGPNVSLTTNDVGEGSTNKYFTDARARNSISAIAPLNYNATTGVLSMTTASTNSSGFLTASDFTTFNNKQTALTAGVDYLSPTGSAASLTNFPTLNQNTTGNAATATKLATSRTINGVAFDGSTNITVAADANTLTGTSLASNVVNSSLTTLGTITSGVWSGTIIDIAKGGTGASTAAAARTNLGLAIGTDVLAPNASITAATKTKITYDTKGLVTAGTDATTADIAPSTNRNYVTDAQAGVLLNTSGVNTGDQTITLTGDVSGTGTGSFATTVNSVGGVGSSTISGFDTRITNNTSSITTLNTNVAANTASITSNTADIALKASIASPNLTGTPTAPTATAGTNTTQLATTAFVNTAVSNYTPTTSLSLAGGLAGNIPYQTAPGTTGFIPNGAANQFLTATGSGTYTWTSASNVTGNFVPYTGATAAVDLGSYDLTVNGVSVGKGGGSKSDNTVLGLNALSVNTTGNYNTAVGTNALKNSTNGQNTALGNTSLFQLTTGTNNTALGYHTLSSATTQSSNTAVGDQAMRKNTGSYNTALGSYSLYGITTGTMATGSYNTGIGYLTLQNATTAGYNAALGSKALSNLTTGNDNTVIGYNSGALSGTATGTALTSANQSVLIGSGVRAGTNSSTNEVVIGYQAIGNGSNTVTIGNTSNTATYITGDLNLTGVINGGTWSGTVIGSNYGGAGSVNGLLKANGRGVVSAAVAGTDYQAPLTATQVGVISNTSGVNTGDQTITLTGDITGTGTGSFAATLTNTTVTAGAYGSSTAIPTFTVDSKGRLTAAGTVGITAGVNSLNYTSTTSYADGGTISGTVLTLTAADGTNPGLLSTGAQMIAGAKTFSSNVTAPNFLGNVTGTVTGNLSGTATIATNLAGGVSGSIPYQTAAGTTAMIPVGSANQFLTSVAGGTYTWTSATAVTGNNVPYTGATGAVNLGAYDLTVNGLTVGEGGGSDVSNTAVGNQALFNNVIGGVAVFYGTKNTALGYQSMLSNISGYNNTSFGNSALKANTTGASNTSIGANALTAISNGFYNTSIGMGSLDNLTSGSDNIAIGSTAGRNITGGSSTLTTSNQSIYIGGSARAKANASTNEIVIGYGATGNGNNTVTIGNTSITDNYFRGSINLTGNLNGGTWSGTTIGSNYGGAGSVNGLLKANGSGIVSAAVAGTDYLVPNSSITGSTKTKITYDTRGFVTAGADATTSDIAPSTNRNYVTDIQAGVISNTSGINTGDQTITLTGDVTGSGTGSFTSTLSNTGVTANTYGSATLVPVLTIDAKGRITSASTTSINGGVNTMTAISATSNANGATISGTALTLTPADATNGGVVTTGTQAFAGVKTFNNDVYIKATSGSIRAGSGNGSLQYNTAFGILSLQNTTGNDNSGFGYYSLSSNTSGAKNAAFGSWALAFNTTGSNNVAMGYQALGDKAIYNRNIAIGSSALRYATGDDNIAIGNEAGLNLGTSGTAGTALKNIIIGSSAGVKVGSSTSIDNTTGRNSVLIGYDVRPAANDETNEIVISGYNGTAGTVGLGSNTTLIGSSTTTSTRIMGALNLPNSTTSTSTSTGALTVGGGAGIVENLNVGGNVKITGTIEIDGGSPGAGKVLTSDANGIASWSSAGSGVSTLTYTAATSYAVGGTISSTNLILAAADGTNPGLISTGAQTIAGAKTFTSALTVSPSVAAVGAAGATTSIAAQSATSTGFAGGGVVITAGNGVGTGYGGNVNITAGTGNSTGGNINLSPGTFPNMGKVNIVNSDLYVNSNSLRVGSGNNNVITNTAMGVSALNSNSSNVGSNTAIGYFSLYTNTSGISNTAIGSSTLTVNSSGRYNTAIGDNAMYSNTTSDNNTAIGYYALYANNGGAFNVAVGGSSGWYNQTGSNNTSVGYQSLYATSVTNTSNNTAIGYRTLSSGNTGGYNTVVGSQSGYNLTAGVGNTALGYNSLYYNSTGSYNTALGYASGPASGTYSSTNSVFVGYNAKPQGTAVSTNEIVIGANATGLGSNTTLIGSSTTTNARIIGALDLPSTTASISTSTGALTVAGGAGIAGALNVGGTTTLIGAATISNTTASTSTTTGALIVRGGVGVAGNVTIGGTLEIDGGSPGAGKVLTSDANGLASWSNAAGSTVVTTNTSYTITLAESIVFYTGTAAGTFTIPAAASTNAGKEITIKNKTAFGITVTPATGTIFIDSANTGAANASIGIEASNNWIKLVSDGTQWNVLRALF